MGAKIHVDSNHVRKNHADLNHENLNHENLNHSDCRGETASGRRRKARAPQIARAEEPQAQDAHATKQARPQTKKEESTRVKSTVKLNIKVKPVNLIHFRYKALDSREQRVARLWDRRPAPPPWPAS